MMHTRCDDRETVFYFSEKDLQGLNKLPFDFPSSLGHTLKGYFYSYDSPRADRLIIFEHGFGGGHTAYMKEIELLCKQGYEVFSYDHTGCMESGGETPNGLSQSLRDLNDCINALFENGYLEGKELSVIGHSWGAFSTMNIAALQPSVSRVVAMCGFVSVEEMINCSFSGLLKGYRKAIMKVEREANPDFVGFNSVRSLKDSRVKALLIYSDNDSICHSSHYQAFKEAFEGSERVSVMLEHGKGHNPNYTAEAVAYLEEFAKGRKEISKNKRATAKEKSDFVSSYDWNKMTLQDERVWKAIFEHFEK